MNSLLSQMLSGCSDTMSSIKIYIVFLMVVIFSCRSLDTQPTTKIKSDTAAVLELAIRTAFYHENLPSIDPLKKRYHFGDSILFSSGTLPLSILPKTIDSLNFKILSQKEIFLLVVTESNLSKIPNYLNIGAFEKSDSGYYVSVQSLNCLNFGGGGKIGIYITKQNDSFIVKRKMSSNIN